jgi:starvation-inducible DNA-binding protein
MQPAIGISEAHLQAIAQALSKVLADEYILYTKTRNAHWNVEGPDFYDKHNLINSSMTLLSVSALWAITHPVRSNKCCN